MSPKRTNRRARRAPARVAMADVQESAQLPLVAVPAAGTLRVVVDVGPMAIPYSVAYAGRTVIKSLVDRSEPVAPLEAGDRVLSWSFAHTLKDWSHTIAVSVNDGPLQILEEMSEANKDTDHSVGIAIVRTEAAS